MCCVSSSSPAPDGHQPAVPDDGRGGAAPHEPEADARALRAAGRRPDRAHALAVHQGAAGRRGAEVRHPGGDPGRRDDAHAQGQWSVLAASRHQLFDDLLSLDNNLVTIF